MDFGRLVTAMVTPLDKDLNVDWGQVEKLVDYLIEEQHSDSLLVSGTTGESPTLTDDEKMELFKVVSARAKGRAKVIAGSGSNETAHTLHLSKEAEKIGVDGLLIVSPYYNRPSQEGLYQHFKATSQVVDLPIMIYNIPGRTAVNIESDTIIRLAEIDNIVSVKESSGDLSQMTRIISNTPDDFTLYSGDDYLTLPVLSVGGTGIVSVASHVAGPSIKAMMTSFFNGENAKAVEDHARLLPLFSGLFSCIQGKSPAAIKYVLNYTEIEVGEVRLPMAYVSEDEKQFLQNLIDGYKA